MQHGFAYDTMRRAEAYRHHHGLGGAGGAGGSGAGGGGDAQADQLVLQHSLAVSSVPSLDQQVGPSSRFLKCSITSDHSYDMKRMLPSCRLKENILNCFAWQANFCPLTNRGSGPARVLISGNHYKRAPLFSNLRFHVFPLLYS